MSKHLYLQTIVSEAVCEVILRHSREANFELRKPYISSHLSANRYFLVVREAVQKVIFISAIIHQGSFLVLQFLGIVFSFGNFLFRQFFTRSVSNDKVQFFSRRFGSRRFNVLGASSFSKTTAAPKDPCSMLCLVSIGHVSMGTEGPASTSARVVVASTASFAGAGVDALVDSKTTSSTLAILLLGVIAGALDTFGNSGSGGGLRIFGNPADSSSSSSSTAFSLASVGRFGAPTDSAFSCPITLGTLADSPLELTGARYLGSAVEDFPSASFGTLAVSIHLGRCIKTLIFLPFGAAEMAEVATFLFFPCFCEG
jgi:hypothetical protein